MVIFNFLLKFEKIFYSEFFRNYYLLNQLEIEKISFMM